MVARRGQRVCYARSQSCATCIGDKRPTKRYKYLTNKSITREGATSAASQPAPPLRVTNPSRGQKESQRERERETLPRKQCTKIKLTKSWMLFVFFLATSTIGQTSSEIISIIYLSLYLSLPLFLSISLSVCLSDSFISFLIAFCLSSVTKRSSSSSSRSSEWSFIF